jgi:DNA-binding MarR family transcriptional regulator
MDSYLSNNQNRAISFDQPPILVSGDSESALARGRAAVAMSGLRLADAVPLGEAVERMRRQAAASALWIELDDDDDSSAAEELLDHVAKDVAEGRYCVVLAVTSERLDAVSAHAFDTNIDVIVDGDGAGRAAALAIAMSGARRADRLSDMTADKNAARLRQLSDEVSRIAATLARLSTGPTASVRSAEFEARGDAPEVPAETVRAVIRARRLRSRYFGEELFADPAWDMLLDLLQAESSNLRVPVSSLCIAAAVPATTALRWLKTMVQEGIFVRRADPHDGRRVFVELAPQTSQTLRRYFGEVGQVPVI